MSFISFDLFSITEVFKVIGHPLSLSPGTLLENDPVVPTLASEKTASRAQKLVSGFKNHSRNDPFMQDKTSPEETAFAFGQIISNSCGHTLSS